MNFFKSLGSGLLSIVIFIILGFILVFFVKGGVSLAVWLMPFLIQVNTLTTFISLFILLPLAIFKKTRIITAYGLIIASFIFGLSLWVTGFLVTYSFWGIMGIIIGLILAGVGVVPVGFLAALLNGRWDLVGTLIYLVFLTFVSRLLATYIASKIDKENAKRQQDEYVDGEILSEENADPNDDSSDRDSIFPEVVEFIKDKEQVTAEELKDKFDIGYARAARIINDLEKDGHINPPEPNKGRTVNKNPDSILVARKKYLEENGPEDNRSDDVLLQQAQDLVKYYDKISASLIQRRLKTGYIKAVWLIDELEKCGLIGPGNDTNSRDVLVTLDKN